MSCSPSNFVKLCAEFNIPNGGGIAPIINPTPILVTGSSYDITAANLGSILDIANSTGPDTAINLPQQSSIALNPGFAFKVVNTGVYNGVLTTTGSDSIFGGITTIPPGAYVSILLSGVNSGINTWSVSYEPYGYSSQSASANLTLSAPLAQWTDVNTVGRGHIVSLPDVRFGIMPIGKIFYVRNTGIDFFTLNSQGGTTVIPTLAPGQIAMLMNSISNVSTGTIVGAVINSPSFTVNTQIGSSYTVQLTDWGKEIQMNSGTAQTLLIPGTFPSGFWVSVTQFGVGQTNISPQNPLVLNSPSGAFKILSQYGNALVKLYSSTSGVVQGNV